MQRRKFIKTMFLTSGVAMSCNNSLSSSETNDETYRITMLYNNIPGNTNLKAAWGLSVWIEHGVKAVLFDTGGEGDVLLNNISSSGLDIKNFNAVIISHKHWDHVNGIAAVLKEHSGDLPVYVPQQAAAGIKEGHSAASIKGIGNAQELRTNIWTTGQLMASPDLYEQAMAIFREEWQDRYMPFYLGDVYTI